MPARVTYDHYAELRELKKEVEEMRGMIFNLFIRGHAVPSLPLIFEYKPKKKRAKRKK